MTFALLLGFLTCIAGFLVVAYAAQRSAPKDPDAYLLDGRSVGTWVVGLSMAGAANSGFMFLGAVGAGYTVGVNALYWPLGFLLGDLIFWALFPARLNRVARERNVLTIPELIASTHAGPAAQRIRAVAGAIVFVFVGIYLVSQFYAGGKVVNTLAPTLSVSTGAMLTAALIVAYVTRGGIRTSIWTDVAQAIFMILVAFGVLIVLISELGGISTALTRLAAERADLLTFSATQGTLGLIVIIGGFAAAAIGFGLGQPHSLVRLLAGASPEKAQRARWIYISYGYSLWLGMTVFGLLLALVLPGLTDPEQGLPRFASNQLTPFLAGVVLAGIFSAVASTASAQLLVCSSALSCDISPRLQRWGAKFGVRFQYAATLFVGLITALLAGLNDTFSVYSLVLYATVALGCAIAPGVFISVLKLRSTATSLIAALITGAAVSVGWNAAGLTAHLNEVVPGFAAALLINWLLARNVNQG
jgi:sodium/proline symporter